MLLPVIDWWSHCMWSLLEYTGVYYFPLYLSSRLCFMDGWVFKRAFFEHLIHIMIKGKTTLPVPYYLGLIIKYDQIIPIRYWGRVVIKGKVMGRSNFQCQQPYKFLLNAHLFPLIHPTVLWTCMHKVTGPATKLSSVTTAFTLFAFKRHPAYEIIVFLASSYSIIIMRHKILSQRFIVYCFESDTQSRFARFSCGTHTYT